MRVERIGYHTLCMTLGLLWRLFAVFWSNSARIFRYEGGLWINFLILKMYSVRSYNYCIYIMIWIRFWKLIMTWGLRAYFSTSQAILIFSSCLWKCWLLNIPFVHTWTPSLVDLLRLIVGLVLYFSMALEKYLSTTSSDIYMIRFCRRTCSALHLVFTWLSFEDLSIIGLRLKTLKPRNCKLIHRGGLLTWYSFDVHSNLRWVSILFFSHTLS